MRVAEFLGCTKREVVADETLLRLQADFGDFQFPAFRFTTERRREAIGQVVRILVGVLATPWTIASWLTNPHPT